MSETSIIAYYNVLLSGQLQRNQDRIMRLMHRAYPRKLTRNEIARCFKKNEMTGKAYDGRPAMPLASVCGAVFTLVKDGLLVEKHEWKGPDPITGNPAKFLRAVIPEAAHV
jgi:hypothetical protein